MEQLKSGSIVILLLVAFCQGVQSQQVINNVSIENKRGNVYQVQYSLNQSADFDIERAVLKIYRRRNGQIQEVFSLPVSVPTSNGQVQQSRSFDWTASNGIVQKGDELQAKIVLTLKASVAKQRLNRIPVANAGSFMQMELPITKPIELNGSKSRDEDGRIVSVEWKQIGGPTTLSISGADSLVARADGEFKPGTYAFELTVKDNLGSVSTSRTALTVKGTSYWSSEHPVNSNPAPKTQSPSVPVQKSQTKLKGGPANAALDLLLPGLGHYFVSGNYNGEDRKPTAFVASGVYLASVAGAFYFYNRYNTQYDKYNELANFREYQKDANGQIIGVRGANQSEAESYYNAAKASQRNSLVCIGVAGGIMVGEVVSTILKGNRNKKEWESSNTSFRPHLFISSDGQQAIAGLQFKF
jgi:hypothetical protein